MMTLVWLETSKFGVKWWRFVVVVVEGQIVVVVVVVVEVDDDVAIVAVVAVIVLVVVLQKTNQLSWQKTKFIHGNKILVSLTRQDVTNETHSEHYCITPRKSHTQNKF